jgi:serine/threonine protein kinase
MATEVRRGRLSAGDERVRQRFPRESKLAASLEHPNVVRTLALGEADRRLYLAMEFVDARARPRQPGAPVRQLPDRVALCKR